MPPTNPATGTLNAFFASAPRHTPRPTAGSDPWAAAYAAEIRRVWIEHASYDARTLQRHLGPSEIGGACDREIVHKLLGRPATNHVTDPWPSIRGRALHAFAEEVMAGDNARHGARWLTERKVTPFDEHPGTADLYDGLNAAVVDWKFLGESTLDKLRKAPPRKYVRQLLQYGLGYVRLGLPVRRVVIVGMPATKASLDSIYVWQREFSDEDGQILPDVAAELTETWNDNERRKAQAAQVEQGLLAFGDTPFTPGESCFFCPIGPKCEPADTPNSPPALP